MVFVSVISFRLTPCYATAPEDTRLRAVLQPAWVHAVSGPGQSSCPQAQAVATRQRLHSSGRQVAGILKDGSMGEFSRSLSFSSFPWQILVNIVFIYF